MASDGKTMMVLGGGLVGATLSLYLARQGFRVALYEGRSDPRKVRPQGGRSINLTIAERGWKAFRDVGVEDVVRDMAIRLRGRLIHRQDQDVLFQPYGEDGESLFAITRAALNAKLIEILSTEPNVALHFDHRCVDVDPDTATVRFECPANGGKLTACAERIFCADGAHSIGRRALMRCIPGFQYSHQYSRYWYKELQIPPRQDGSYPLKPDALHIWPRTSSIFAAFPNPDRSFTLTMMMPFDDPISFSTITTPEELRRLLETRFPDLVSLLPDWTEQYFSRRINSIATLRCFPWSYQDKLVLLGDAAHVFVPYLGQGLNAGLEDCTVLMSCIERCGDDWEQTFDEFQRLRKQNIDAVADLAHEHFTELSERVADPNFILRKRIENRLHSLYPERFCSLYNLITFTQLPYADARKYRVRQDAFVDRLLSVDQIERHLGTPEFDRIVHEMVRST